jgi:hypothetical protein
MLKISNDIGVEGSRHEFKMIRSQLVAIGMAICQGAKMNMVGASLGILMRLSEGLTDLGCFWLGFSFASLLLGDKDDV